MIFNHLDFLFKRLNKDSEMSCIKELSFLS